MGVVSRSPPAEDGDESMFERKGAEMDVGTLTELAAGKAVDSAVVDLVTAGMTVEDAKRGVEEVATTLSQITQQARAALDLPIEPEQIGSSLAQLHGIPAGLAGTIVSRESAKMEQEKKVAAEQQKAKKKIQRSNRNGERLVGVVMVVAGGALAPVTGGASLPLSALGLYRIAKGKGLND